MSKKDELLWKGFATGAGVAAGIFARNMATKGWVKTQGGDPPTNPADPSTSWTEALAWTTVVGVLVGTARLFARRAAAELWLSRAGETPPGLEDVSA